MENSESLTKADIREWIDENRGGRSGETSWKLAIKALTDIDFGSTRITFVDESYSHRSFRPKQIRIYANRGYSDKKWRGVSFKTGSIDVSVLEEKADEMRELKEQYETRRKERAEAKRKARDVKEKNLEIANELLFEAGLISSKFKYSLNSVKLSNGSRLQMKATKNGISVGGVTVDAEQIVDYVNHLDSFFKTEDHV